MTQLAEVFNNIATAINHKGISGQMTPREIPEKIAQIGEGPGYRYGVTMDTIFKVDENGDVMRPDGVSYLNFHGIKSITEPSVFYFKFNCCDGIETVEFPDLVKVNAAYSMQSMFSSYKSKIKTVSFPELSVVNGLYAMYSILSGCPDLAKIEFPSVVSCGYLSMGQMCSNCQSLSSIDFSNLKSAGSTTFTSAFFNCSSLADIEFPSLTAADFTAFGGTFANCTSLSSVDFPVLSNIRYRQVFLKAFNNCTNLKTLTFPAVTELSGEYTAISGATFGGNNTITDIYFPNVKNVYHNYLFDSACTSLTGVHFPADSTDISDSVGYPTMWGAPATCNILFDL